MNQLVKLSYYFSQKTFKRKQMIYKEGDSAENVYIIRKGEIELCRDIEVTRKNLIKIDAHGRPMPRIKSRKKKIYANLAIRAEGEIVGDEEVLLDIPRLTSCICYSEFAVVYVISKLEFKRRIRKEESLTYFSEKNKLRAESREKITSVISKLKC